MCSSADGATEDRWNGSSVLSSLPLLLLLLLFRLLPLLAGDMTCLMNSASRAASSAGLHPASIFFFVFFFAAPAAPTGAGLDFLPTRLARAPPSDSAEDSTPSSSSSSLLLELELPSSSLPPAEKVPLLLLLLLLLLLSSEPNSLPLSTSARPRARGPVLLLAFFAGLFVFTATTFFVLFFFLIPAGAELEPALTAFSFLPLLMLLARDPPRGFSALFR
jgi:hypothetical protein